MSVPVFLELGRFGDVLNVLPILRDVASAGTKPVLVIARQFATLLDGVSYVTPAVYGGHYSEVAQARDRAEAKLGAPVRVLQVWGRDWPHTRTTDHFNTDSWELAGYLDRWADPTVRLVFDRRDKARESALVRRCIRPRVPNIVVNLRGVSAPWPSAAEFRSWLTTEFRGRAHFVHVDDVRAARLYDVLGLFERAAGIVTVDTSTLHLAGAVGTPVIAMLPPAARGWTIAKPRCNVVASVHVDQWQTAPNKNALRDAVTAIVNGTL